MTSTAEPNPQFRVLFRQFLFRIFDLEVLSARAQGDSQRLLGQFAALLLFISLMFAWGLLGLDPAGMPPSARLGFALFMEHILIATTMLAVGIFAVFTWDSTFPDRRDVLALMPLPVHPRTMFLARIAAAGTALLLVVVLLNAASGLGWPFAFAFLGPAQGGLLSAARWFISYWLTLFAAGAFVYSSLLAVQGLAAQILPRRLFLRASGLMQMGAFCLVVCVFVLEPPVDGLQILNAPEYSRLILSVPTYWFLGLLHELAGSMDPAMAPLASRAWLGLVIAGATAAAAYALSYARTIRQIIEEPDITSRSQSARWLPRFGNPMQTAIGQFCIRSMARSRQHRLILAFYWGIGLACIILLLQSFATAPGGSGAPSGLVLRQPNVPFLAATVMMLVAAVVGARVVFAFPLDLRANWIFRAAGFRGGVKTLVAARRALLLLSVVPVWLVTATMCLTLWPWRQAAGHLAVLGLLGSILADVCLHGYRKIPFTCSYLPGKSQAHLVFLGAIAVVWLVFVAAPYELEALLQPPTTILILLFLLAAAIAVRWRGGSSAGSGGIEPQFEEEGTPAILELGLYRDGAVLGTRPPD